MQKAEFKAGEDWAHRKNSTLEEPAARVELLALVSRGRALRVKVRHAEGEFEGLEEFVHAAHLRCPWREWKQVERDERREVALASSVEARKPLDSVLIAAANEALAASGEDLCVDGVRGYTRLYQEGRTALNRLAERIDLDVRDWLRTPGFIDRHGTLYLGDEHLVTLASRFAEAEPEAVTLYLDNEEQTYLSEGYLFGERFYHDQLLRQKPAWTIARSWAAKGEGRDYLREELKRVGDLLYQALDTLEAAGEARKATRLRRAWEQKR